MAVRAALAEIGLEDRTYSIDEWLELERRTGEKLEYHEGRVVPWRAMAGGSHEHSVVGANLQYGLGAAVRELQRQHPEAPFCRVHTSDLRIKIAGASRYVYPDAAIVCGEPTYDPLVPSAVTNPVLVAEVLSPSSVRYDMGEKFDYYARLEALRTYVLVAQDDYAVEVRTRTGPQARWVYAFAKTLGEAVRLPALGLALPMAEVYRGIAFEDGEEEAVGVG